METMKIYDVHTTHKVQLNKLNFYKDEIKIGLKRIEEVASKNSSKECLAQVEHFENQFKIQRNNIDELVHSVNESEQRLQKNIAANPTAADHRSMPVEKELNDRVLTFEKNFNQIRQELIAFLAKWM